MKSTSPNFMVTILRYLTPLSLLIMTTGAQASLINFDIDGGSLDFSAGTVITNQYNTLGITVSATGGSDDAMIFDSSNPSGGDWDLGTPNESYGGPGKGSGGGSNDIALGNILIISEDGDSQDPDDNAGGGIIRFDFATEVIMNSIGILDIDADEGEQVRLFDVNDVLLNTFDFLQVGNNGFQEIVIANLGGIRRMDVVFTGSGAITDFEYTSVPEPSIIALFGLGLIGLGFARRRRTHN